MEGQIGFFFSTGGEKLLKELYLRKSTAPAPDFDDEMLDFKQILWWDETSGDFGRKWVYFAYGRDVNHWGSEEGLW